MEKTPNIQIEFLPVENLLFDRNNPRIPNSSIGNNEEEVLRWMLSDASLIELMGSIGEQGYFPGEPLLGVREQNKVVIVEGNRRLAAVKLLLNPEIAPIMKTAVQKAASGALIKPSTLPVLIYGDRKSILDYLGYRHVTGIKAWDPLAKARYLQELYDIELNANNSGQSKFQRLAKKIGSRADYVAKLLTGYAIYRKIEENDFFNIKGINEDSIDFSVLTTALSYTNISSFIGLESVNDPELSGLDQKQFPELIKWLFEENSEGRTRIGESRNLSLLSKIVSNDKSLKEWRDGATIQQAVTLTETPLEIFRISILDSFTHLSTAREYSHLVEKADKSSIKKIQEIKDMASDLFVVMSNRTN